MALPKDALRKDAWKLFEAGFSTEGGDLETYLERILVHCVDWFGATGASIFLKEGVTEEFGLAAQAGSDSNIPRNATIRKGTGIAGTSIESGEALLINDPAKHPLLESRIKHHHVGLRSSIVMPLMAVNDGCIGVLNLSRSLGANDFLPSDLQRVAAFAQHISLAVSNARLFASLNESRKAEAAARSKLEGVVHALGVAVLVFDSTGRITDANRKAQQMIDQSGEQGELALGGVSSELSNVLATALNKARTSSYVRTRAHDLRQDRSWSIVCTPLLDGGATAVIEETTQHEHNQSEMARLARLAEIGQMTAAIAHEIRNPLTGIRTAAQMIVTAPEHSAEFGAIIEEEVLKLNEICEEFLEFSRPLALKRKLVDLRVIAARLQRHHQGEFDENGIELNVEIEDEEPTINGDALRIEQVMRNLLLNALQACGKGGTVRATLRVGGFSIEDTGKGMREADLEKLFTPFFTTRAKGTGLGLCNARKIVDAHGGNLNVSSEFGVGSRFDVTFGSRQ